MIIVDAILRTFNVDSLLTRVVCPSYRFDIMLECVLDQGFLSDQGGGWVSK